MGATLTLTATEFAATQTELVPVPWAAAHPPLTGLLFRYWHNKSSGFNSATEGFIAGRYMFTNVMPPTPPQCEEFKEWSDVFSHLNGDEIASPYVSVSNSFAWICRQALGQSERGQTNIRITVIDASTLDREKVFHAKPYHKEIRKKYAFTDGAHRYPATYELLVWHEIPQQAILGTFTIQDLLSLETKDASIATALRLQELSEQNRGYRTTILPRWIAEKVGLDDGIIRTMAELCDFAKANVSSIEHVSYVVSEYITGWGIAKSPLTAEQWLKQANQFAEAFMQLRSLSASLPVQTTLMTGYLFGVQLSCGDANTLFRPATAQLMRKRAKAIGLEDPATIVAQYFHDSLSAVFCHDNLHRRLLDLPPSDVQVRDRLQEFRADVDFRGRPNMA
nr:hypothetical protein CFP56_09019 [Quercus suber]